MNGEIGCCPAHVTVCTRDHPTFHVQGIHRIETVPVQGKYSVHVQRMGENDTMPAKNRHTPHGALGSRCTRIQPGSVDVGSGADRLGSIPTGLLRYSDISLPSYWTRPSPGYYSVALQCRFGMHGVVGMRVSAWWVGVVGMPG